jgi:hypothetical protein
MKLITHLSHLLLIVIGLLGFWSCESESTTPEKTQEPCLLQKAIWTSNYTNYTSITTYQYNDKGQLISERTSQHDSLGEKGWGYQSGSSFQYDSLGFLIYKKNLYTDQRTSYKYENGRLTSVWDIANTARNHIYLYDQNGKVSRYTYNNTSPNMQLLYWYEFEDGVLTKSSTNTNSTIENGHIVKEHGIVRFWEVMPVNFTRYSYDEKGRKILSEYIDGNTQKVISSQRLFYDDAVNYIDPLAETYRFKGFPTVELYGKTVPSIRSEMTSFYSSGTSVGVSEGQVKKNSKGLITERKSIYTSTQNGKVDRSESKTIYIYSGCQ